MARLSMSPGRYRVATLAALVFLYVIAVSGALVRLTGSGLGCDDWPNCNQNRFVDVSSQHAAIEQINRLFTGAVTIAVALAVLGAVVRAPRRRDLTWLSIGLVLGVLGQAVLGAVVVKTHLNPVAVQGHFLLSMLLLADGIVLHRRAAQPDGGIRTRLVSEPTRRLAWIVVALTSLALTTGTIVTGTGPHSGSVAGDPVRRFGFAITSVARVHSLSVWMTLGAIGVLLWRLRTRTSERMALETPIWILLGLAVGQGTLGYIQYFSGVPVALVAVHVAGASAVCLAAVHLGLSTTTLVTPTPEETPAPPGVLANPRG